MLIPSFILFLTGAVAGIVMGFRSFKGLPNPWALSAVHGIFVATGLVLLLVAFLNNEEGTFIGAGLALLAIAALTGFYLVSFHLRKTSHPRSAIVIHALLAVSGVVFLLLSLI